MKSKTKRHPDTSRKALSALTVAALATAAVACGGNSGGGGGDSPAAPSCQLVPQETKVAAGSRVAFELKANFQPQSVELDGVNVYETKSSSTWHGKDASSSTNGATGTDAAAAAEASGDFAKTFEVSIYEAREYEASLANGDSVVTCSAAMELTKADDPGSSGPIGDGEGSLVLGLTSTAKGGGKHQAVVRCTLPNDYYDSHVVSSDYTDKQVLLQDTSKAVRCDLGVPQLELAAAPENMAPSAYLPGGLREDGLPISKSFQVQLSTGDTTDQNFVFGYNTYFYEGWTGMFTGLDSCHTVKVEGFSRESDLTDSPFLITWERKIDPISGATIWRLKDGETRPNGVNIRGAFQRRFRTYFYCDWEHKPTEMIVASSWISTEEGSFKATGDMRFDVEIAVGTQGTKKTGITYEDFRSLLQSVKVDQGDELAVKIAIRGRDGKVIASNDRATATEPALQAKWDSDCEGKVTPKLSVLADEASGRLPGNGGAVKATFKLCDFQDALLSDLAAVETKKDAPITHQVVIACVAKDTSSSSYFESKWDWNNCSYGVPADDVGAENVIPRLYAPGGERDQIKPKFRQATIKLDEGSTTAWSLRLYEIDFAFVRQEDCQMRTVLAPLSAGGTAKTTFRKRYNDTDWSGSAREKFDWSLTSSMPDFSQLLVNAQAEATFYTYCRWSEDDFGKGINAQ
jgi:hypothetical protein